MARVERGAKTVRALRVGTVALAVALFMGAAAPMSAASYAADDSATQARLDRLERALRDLERDYYKGTGHPASTGYSAAAAGDDNIALRLTALEESLRTLTGQVEQLTYRLNQMQAGGAQASAQAAPSSAAAVSAPTIPEPSPEAPPDKGVQTLGSYSQGASDGATGANPTAPAGDENAQFAAAVNVLYRGDNEGGAAALQSFVTQHPKSPKAGEAYFWLGEAQLAQKAYREAAEAYLTTVQKYPKDAKAPQALVKLGSTLIQGGQKSEGCKQLKHVKSVFPKASKSVLDMATRERARAGCK